MYNEKINTKLLKKIIEKGSIIKDKKNIIALGIDQGYANSGYAIVKYNIHTNHYKILNYGTIQTSSKLDIEKRLLIIYDKLKDIIEKYPIDIVACERLFVNSNREASGSKKRNKSVSIVKTNMSTGIIYLLCAQYNMPIKDYPPTTIKKQLTGSGKADKEDIIQIIEEIMLKQNLEIHTNHESDAIAIGITAISHLIEKLFLEEKSLH